MATGQAVRIRIAPGAALPALPPSRASAGTSTDSSPASSTAASVVWNRVSAAVMQTVPAGIVRSDTGARSTENRSVPTALAAGMRVIPRMAPCRSR